eukprot:TRINITY_DN1589_c0_g2_i1.p1 TRINITY_DN1589_c0_g2~~TRINITY_DN1589_c0_g2_i1.p1  ORF type:complete len:250 (+),score=30.80 TRINITY_DN1589_c0_g2_i1:216-965(+)
MDNISTKNNININIYFNINSDKEIEKINPIIINTLKNLDSLENSKFVKFFNGNSNEIVRPPYAPLWLDEEDFYSFNFLCVSNKELLDQGLDNLNYIKMKYHEVTKEDIEKLMKFDNLKYLNLHGCVFKDGSENNLTKLLDKHKGLIINTISTNIPINFYSRLDLEHLLNFIFMEYSILKGDRVMDYLEFCLQNQPKKVFTSSQLKTHYLFIEGFLFENNSLGDDCVFEEDYDWNNVNNEEWDNYISNII